MRQYGVVMFPCWLPRSIDDDGRLIVYPVGQVARPGEKSRTTGLVWLRGPGVAEGSYDAFFAAIKDATFDFSMA